jgi:hypothetical protein
LWGELRTIDDSTTGLLSQSQAEKIVASAAVKLLGHYGDAPTFFGVEAVASDSLEAGEMLEPSAERRGRVRKLLCKYYARACGNL